MGELIVAIPKGFLEFFIVLTFSLIIGLEQRRIHAGEKAIFGTDRTFTFIGILGFILYILQPETLLLFGGGGLSLIILFAIFYHKKIALFKDFGLTSVTIALITYCLAPLVFTQPKWLVILIVISVLIFAELKPSFLEISSKFKQDEFITLGKFLALIGVILPIVPDDQLFSFINITPYKIWLAVVVVSSISYLSYLLQKFVFKKSGIIVSGILGGLYSSTATTMIISRKTNKQKQAGPLYNAAIIFATSMMYLRVLIILFIFNQSLAVALAPYFIILFICAFLVGSFFIWRKHLKRKTENILAEEHNPLELKIALLFAVLYVVFNFATYFAVQKYGEIGLSVLSFIVGFTHIDPFLINLFQGKYEIAQRFIAFATFQAIISNNILKSVYAWFLASSQNRKPIIAGIGIIIVINIIVLFFI